MAKNTSFSAYLKELESTYGTEARRNYNLLMASLVALGVITAAFLITGYIMALVFLSSIFNGWAVFGMAMLPFLLPLVVILLRGLNEFRKWKAEKTYPKERNAY